MQGVRLILSSAVLAAALVGLVPGVALAAQPTCGAVLVADTTLTGDLDCSAHGGPALTVGTHGIVVDLNGYTIWGPSGGDGNWGIGVVGWNDVRIRNGTIANYSHGLLIDLVVGLRVRSLVIAGEVADEVDRGVTMYQGARNRFRDLTITGVYYGMFIEDTADAIVTDSEVTATSRGFYVSDAARPIFVGNTATAGDPASVGFYSFHTGHGKFIANTANGGHIGFEMDCQTAGPVRLEGNVAMGNTFRGFSLYNCYDHVSGWAPGTGSVILNNRAIGNDDGAGGGDGFWDDYSVNAVWKYNRAHDNGNDGFHLTSPAGSVFLYNRAHRNGNDGFDILSNSGSANAHRFSWNRARDNGADGFYAGFGVPGKGNRSSGNSGSSCVNVGCAY